MGPVPEASGGGGLGHGRVRGFWGLGLGFRVGERFRVGEGLWGLGGGVWGCRCRTGDLGT